MAPVVGSPRLVGRRAELAAACRLVEAAARGEGATLLVTGEAGIGKSRLVAEIAARAVDAGLPVVTGRAVQGGGTFRPVAQALAGLVRERRLDSARLTPFRAALRRLLRGAAADPVPDLALDPTVVFGEGVLALLREVHGGGCLLVLEDLHWADPDTLDLLGYLADVVSGASVLLALTARDDVAVPGVAALAAHPRVTTLPLTRMGDVEVAALAAACRGGTPLPEPELGELVARSDGLPFLVEELLDPARPPTGVPPTFAGLVAGRLAALAGAHRSVLAAAAVTGGDPDWRLLGAVAGAGSGVGVDVGVGVDAGVDEQTVLAALRAATDVGLLVVEDGRLRWRHALTQDAVRATLLAPERAVLAARAAQVMLARSDPDDRPAAAELLVLAGQPERAAEIFLELARCDAGRGALRSAEALLARAAGTGRLAGRVAAERVRVLTILGRVGDALDVGAAGLDGVVGELHAELCLNLARAAVHGGRWASAEDYLARAGRPADPRSLVLAADAAFGPGEVARAVALARAAVAAAGGDNRPEILCESLVCLGRALFATAPEESEAMLRRAAQVAAEHDLTPWRVEALFQLGAFEYTRGDLAAPALAAARELGVQAGVLAQVVRVDLLRADGLSMRDGPRAVRPLAERTAERAGRLRLPALQAMCELVAASGAAAAGDLPAMTVLLDAAASRPDAPREVAGLTPVVTALPHVLNHNLPAAAALFDEGMGRLLSHGSAAPMAYFGLWALLRTALADRDELARDTLRAHHTILSISNRGALDYAEAIAAGRDGRREEAATRFAEADASLAGLPWWNRLLRLLALEAAVAQGWGDPVPALRVDLAAHEHAGEPGLARTCRDLLRAAGAPTRRGRGRSSVPPALRARGITSREVDVLTLVAAGLTNAEIAARLFLSRRTVDTHVAHLLAKSATAGRGELRTWALAHGVPALTR